MTVTVGDQVYPADEKVLEFVRVRTDDVTCIDGLAIAEDLGNTRMVNTIVLGALASRLDVDEETWLSVIEARVPPKYAELNRKAFRRGREAVS